MTLHHILRTRNKSVFQVPSKMCYTYGKILCLHFRYLNLRPASLSLPNGRENKHLHNKQLHKGNGRKKIVPKLTIDQDQLADNRISTRTLFSICFLFSCFYSLNHLPSIDARDISLTQTLPHEPMPTRFLSIPYCSCRGPTHDWTQESMKK